MKPSEFDAFTRALTTAASRREVLKLFGTAGGALMLDLIGLGGAVHLRPLRRAQEEVWTGVTELKDEKVHVRVILVMEDTEISGRMYVLDPETSEPIDVGPITGTRAGDRATWTTVSDQVVEGTFSGNTFSGTITFPARLGEPAFTAEIRLTRGDE